MAKDLRKAIMRRSWLKTFLTKLELPKLGKSIKNSEISVQIF